jgi:aryl-alcohol dehydrogenase-like predicted oxidoreductase
MPRQPSDEPAPVAGAEPAAPEDDRIDLLWVHIWDPHTPIEETMRALDDAVSAGKVLYVGISDTPAWVIAKGQTLAALRGWSPFIGTPVALQPGPAGDRA